MILKAFLAVQRRHNRCTWGVWLDKLLDNLSTSPIGPETEREWRICIGTNAAHRREGRLHQDFSIFRGGKLVDNQRDGDVVSELGTGAPGGGVDGFRLVSGETGDAADHHQPQDRQARNRDSDKFRFLIHVYLYLSD